MRRDIEVFVGTQNHNFSSFNLCVDDIPFHLLYNDDDLDDNDECKEETARDDEGQVVLRGIVHMISADLREAIAAKFFRPPKPKRSARHARQSTHRIQQPNEPPSEFEREVSKPRKTTPLMQHPANIVNAVATGYKNRIRPSQAIREAGYEYNNSTKGLWSRLKCVCMLIAEEEYQLQRLLIVPHKGDTFFVCFRR